MNIASLIECSSYIRCEPFSTYPRTYDLLHANHLFTHHKNLGHGCLLEDIMLEMDRILRPKVINLSLIIELGNIISWK